MFLDEAEIIAIAGDGGHGCVAFRREKYTPRGGPAGGDGGRGGSVFVVADPSLNTLQHLAGHHHWRASRGGNGEGKDRHGRKGKDIEIAVPPGTIVRDADTDLVLKDLAAPGERVRVAAGGEGGRGNIHFKSPTNQAPRQADPGQSGQQRRLHLELKLIADAGLIGKPNAGKSTLLSRLSDAHPKIASYPFTTLSPSLGIVELPGWRRLVLADIPGLIEGAHDGAGLGVEFLRHVERTGLLIHVVDIAPLDGDPAEDYRVIREELRRHSPALADKPEVVVANKMDLSGSLEALDGFREAVGREAMGVSAVTGEGLDRMMEAVWRTLHPGESE